MAALGGFSSTGIPACACVETRRGSRMLGLRGIAFFRGSAAQRSNAECRTYGASENFGISIPSPSGLG
jgi:hypothetical protein